jgi:hypothetical protein
MAVSSSISGNSGDARAFRRSDSSTPRLGQRWEYQEILIPLRLGTIRGWLGEQRLFQKVARRADQEIERSIERLGEQGWKPDESTSFVSLYRRERVDASYRGGMVPGHSVRAVNIRFKRPTT